MPHCRVVVLDPETGSEITVADALALGEAVAVARSAGALGSWIVIDTEPDVWLSARSVESMGEDEGLAEERAAVVRYYRLARHLLATQGVEAARLDRDLPLTPDGEVPENA